MLDKYVRETFKLDVFTHPRPRMEEVFGLVYASTLVQPVPAGANAAFTALCRIYTTVIAKTTNWIQPNRRGALCRLIYRCRDDGATTIITFNQDIVIEKSLNVLTDAAGPTTWHPDTGYARAFSKFTARKGSSPHDLFTLSAGDTSTIEVLKPHGSLNWYANTRSKNRVLSQLRPDQKIRCTRRIKLDTEMTYMQKTSSGRGRQRWYTWPIIVPPIMEKGTFLTNALAGIWSRSFERICSAERIIVYGYSFPDADAQSRSFFIRSGARRATSPYLVTINPDIASAQRAHQIFRPQRHLVVDRVRAFLSS
jgi:hypothetical protein